MSTGDHISLVDIMQYLTAFDPAYLPESQTVAFNAVMPVQLEQHLRAQRYQRFDKRHWPANGQPDTYYNNDYQPKRLLTQLDELVRRFSKSSSPGMGPFCPFALKRRFRCTWALAAAIYLRDMLSAASPRAIDGGRWGPCNHHCILGLSVVVSEITVHWRESL